jgi:hypothetical protein
MLNPRVNFIFMLLGTAFVACSLGDSCALGSVYSAQELHELVTDLGRGLVLHPVAHILDFEIPHETGKAGAEFFDGWIEGRLGDLRAFPTNLQNVDGLLTSRQVASRHAQGDEQRVVVR